MSKEYTAGQRQVQTHADSTRLADQMAEKVVRDEISSDDKLFIEARDMFFLATIDADGRANCSYKGGEPGFVRVLDESTIAFPIYDGNGMFMTAGSIVDNGEVGLLFVDFDGQSRMRLNGTATLHAEDELISEYPEAQYVVRVTAREVFVNCPRYIHRLELVERSVFVPKSNTQTPVAEWKQKMIENGAGNILSSKDPTVPGN